MSKHDEYWEDPKEYTLVKHAILEAYLTRWAAILGKPSEAAKDRHLHYIDTHAGRGRHSDGSPGSPLIAQQVFNRIINDKYPRLHVHCHFVERKNENFESLQHELKATKVGRPNISTAIYKDVFQQRLDEILRQVPVLEAAFVFIDPFKYKDADIASVVRFLEGRRYHEVFITFMSQFIAQFMSDPSKHSTVDTVLGTHQWRELVGRGDVEQHVINLYCDQLESTVSSLDGSTAYAYPLTINTTGQKSPYSLVHLSKSPRARLAMERADRSAQGLEPMVKLFARADYSELILNGLPTEGTIKAWQLAGAVWSVDRYASWEDDIVPTLKHLHMQDAINLTTSEKKARKPGIKPRESDLISRTGHEVKQVGLF